MQLHNNLKPRACQISCLVLLFAICYLLFAGHSVALDATSQKILDLRAQIDVLTKQAAQYKGTIAQKQKEAESLNKQITILNNQILRLQTQIKLTGAQISELGLEIGDTNDKIYDTIGKINTNEAVIGELINSINQRDHDTLLTVLVKNQTLSAFMSQVQYSENLNGKLSSILSELKSEKEILLAENDKLTKQRTDYEVLNKKRVTQKSSLDSTIINKASLLKSTKGQEQRYQQLLSETEKKQAEFFTQLQQIEKNAVASGAAIIHVTATSIPPKGSKFFQYPLDEYRLTQGYGMTSYAKRGAYGGSAHNGIDIADVFGAPIHPIGHGWILASSYNVGFGNWIAVRHDNNMVSVYAHMSGPAKIGNGVEVSANDTIGYEGSTGSSTGPHVHLSLYKDFFTYLNPKNNQLYFNYWDGSLNPLDYL